jgi:hypothetical protein
MSGTEPVLQLTAVTTSRKLHVAMTAVGRPCERLADAYKRQTA